MCFQKNHSLLLFFFYKESHDRINKHVKSSKHSSGAIRYYYSIASYLGLLYATNSGNYARLHVLCIGALYGIRDQA